MPLIVERKVGQSIILHVAGGVTITILRIQEHAQKVRLAVTCPEGVRVVRGPAGDGADQAGADAGSEGEG